MANKKEVLLKQLNNIEPLPAIVLQLAELVEQENPDINQVAQVLETEIGMVTRLLRIANSPFFGFQRRVSSIKEAIVMLGLTGLKNLVTSLVIVKQIDDLGIWDIIDQDKFWQHSIAVAGLSASLASRMNDGGLKSDAYTLGIIHRLGMCVMAYNFPREYEVALSDESILEQNEFAKLGIDHHEVGGLICKQWNLPPYFATAIALGQEKANPRVLNKAGLLTEILNLSIALVPVLGYGAARLIPLPKLETGLDRLGISMQDFLSLWATLPKELMGMVHQSFPNQAADFGDVELVMASTFSESSLTMSFELLVTGLGMTYSIEQEAKIKKCILHYGDADIVNLDKTGLLFDVSPFISISEKQQAVNWVALRQKLLEVIQQDDMPILSGL